MAKDILELIHILAMAVILSCVVSISWTLTEYAVKGLLKNRRINE